MAADLAKPATADLAAAADMTPTIIPANGVCHESGWCWENPLPQGNQMRVLATYGANDLWAVGDAGTVLHYDGTTWTRLASNVDAQLLATWGNRAGNQWFVGTGGTILNWNGTKMTQAVSPVTVDLNAVWGLSDTDIWAAGPNETLLHYQQGQWVTQPQPNPNPGDPTNHIVGLWGAASNDVWAALNAPNSAAQDTCSYHWNGTSWQPSTTPDGATAIYGTASNDVWMLGGGYRWHWNGSIWTPTTGSGKASLWASAPNNYWSAGGLGIFHWDGTNWGSVTSPSLMQNERLNYVIDLDGTRYVATGSPSMSRMFRQDGLHPWAAIGGGLYNLYMLRGWAVSDDEVWVAGNNGFLHRKNGAWSLVPAPGSPGILDDVWGSAPNNVWCVGSNGIILHYDGTTWSSVPSPTQQTLYRISGLSATDIMAVGDKGTLLQWNGSTWSVISTNTTDSLLALWRINDQEFWAGGGSNLLHWKQGQFSIAAALGVDDIWGTDNNNIWAVGGNATAVGIFHWDGTALSSVVPVSSFQPFYAIQGFSTNDVWAVGESLAHWDGTKWTDYPTLADTLLTTVIASPSGDFWTVSNQGGVLHHSP